MTLDSAEECGKLFVGGLSWDTSVERLKEYFGRYGEVIDCAVMKNPETGRSRGFGFISYRDPSCVQLVLSCGPHFLDGRTIDPKSCNAKGAQKGKREAKMMKYPKVFLGGLPSDVNETLLRDFFSKYGKVVEVVIMYNQERKTSRGNGFRGFGFLSFEHEESVHSVVAEHFVTINGKKVEVKRAEPRDKNCSASGHNSTGEAHNLLIPFSPESPQSSWWPNVQTQSGSSVPVSHTSLSASVTNALMAPISAHTAWASGLVYPLTSFPWISSVQSMPPLSTALLPGVSGLIGAASFPHLLGATAFNPATVGTNFNSCHYGVAAGTRIPLPPFAQQATVLAENPALTVTSFPMNTIPPSMTLSAGPAREATSCVPTRVFSTSGFPGSAVDQSYLAGTSLRVKSQLQGYHPYRRM